MIDFGVAKATHQRLTEKTVFTQLGLLIGTPEYMSPEQAEMGGLDVDTRATSIRSASCFTSCWSARSRLTRSGCASRLRRNPAHHPRRRTGESKHAPQRLGNTASEVSRGAGATDVVTFLTRAQSGHLDWVALKATEKYLTWCSATVWELALDVSLQFPCYAVLARPASAPIALAVLLEDILCRHGCWRVLSLKHWPSV